MKRSSMQKPRPPRVRAEVRPSSMQASACRMWDGVARATAPLPKRVPYVNKPLREAYRLIPCQFDGPEGPQSICGRDDGTVVCCHSNQVAHGKGKGQKADDNRAASGCGACHHELDQGTAWSKTERRERFDRAAARTQARLTEMGLWPKSEPAAPQATDPRSG